VTKKNTPALFAAAFLAASSIALADYGVIDEGAWPDSWPKELDPLRNQSRTLEGPQILLRHYEIPFTNREEFEAAWPHLLKVKSKGAPIILVRKTNFFRVEPAGVLIHTPPLGTDTRANPEKPLPGDRNRRDAWLWTSYIELVVDGEIVDLNRIRLPPDTTIIDERFK
jgi:hypothetical protein